MSSLISRFGKIVERFESNNLDLLYEYKDVEIDTFTYLFHFNCNSFNMKQNNSINFTTIFLSKLLFGKQ